MAQTKVAVVTGSNKGIGFAIVRGLCKKFDGDVYVTARDEARGREAVAALEREGLHPKFHQLDIDDVESIERLRSFLADKYGGLDVLVNNAGIAYKGDSTAPFSEQAEVTLKTNYWSTLNVCNALFPLLRSHARVVHLSSFVVRLTLLKCSEALRAALDACKTIDDVSRYMKDFVAYVAAGVHQDHGWPSTAYGVSKVGLTLLTKIQQREIDADTTRSDIVINSCDPGHVATDMSSGKGTLTIEEGAVTPLYAALLPPNVSEPRGEFLSELTVKSIWAQ